ncbi:Do family serine endopeptidase [Hyphobacterium sp. CCMP332]|jgi:serine protease Do|uniref:Do family serine endopeptidase n=1 Tax=Hyphobacterium sp. CCMP332 TaxID=2749086 RepID=UPI00164FE894|nr:Do family serine endopeptidase [Hyphobacterium sp. CCMP332]QNL18292.1 Do family serine endopeptidase [Hyphobacterium sp. CCMP332]
MRILAAFLSFIVLTGAAAAQRFPAEGFADLNDRLAPAVVNISSAQRLGDDEGNMPDFPEGSPLERFNEFFGDAPRIANSLGSGFIIDPSGTVVTNNHVIENGDEIEVTLTDGRTLSTTLIGRDPVTDLAVLQIQSADEDFPYVSFGDSDAARVGDWVIAIGNPFGFGGSLTAGVVSARGRDVGGRYDDYLQSDVAINTGNSGGPLFNLDGDVIGINTLIYSPTGASVGISFSVPSAIAERVVGQLIEYGETRRGWLGVSVQNVDSDLAESLGLSAPRGALVRRITAGGPAADAGLQEGDLVLSFDTFDIVDDRMFSRLVAETEIGRRVQIRVQRRGQPVTLAATVERLTEERPENRTLRTRPEVEAGETEMFGLTLAELDAASRRRFRVHPDAEGVLIVAVDPLSDAAAKARPGDVITEIAYTPVETLAEAVTVLEEYEDGEVALFQLNRGGQFVFQSIRR